MFAKLIVVKRMLGWLSFCGRSLVFMQPPLPGFRFLLIAIETRSDVVKLLLWGAQVSFLFVHRYQNHEYRSHQLWREGPRVTSSPHPGVGVEVLEVWSRSSIPLSRSTIREPLPLFTPAAVVKSPPSVAGFRRAEHTIRPNVRVQFSIEVERPYSDMGGDTQRHWLLGKLERFLGLFEQRHSGARWVR